MFLVDLLHNFKMYLNIYMQTQSRGSKHLQIQVHLFTLRGEKNDRLNKVFIKKASKLKGELNKMPSY